MGKNALVAMTTWSRVVKSFSARPTISSLTPREYMSAVSKKLMPASSARRMNGRLASSGRIQGRQAVDPKVIVPRQRRETRRPVRPRLTYSMSCLVRSDPGAAVRTHCAPRWRQPRAGRLRGAVAGPVQGTVW